MLGTTIQWMHAYEISHIMHNFIVALRDELLNKIRYHEIRIV